MAKMKMRTQDPGSKELSDLILPNVHILEVEATSIAAEAGQKMVVRILTNFSSVDIKMGPRTKKKAFPIVAAFRRASLPLWMIALIVFGVVAVLGVTIGLLVHFLAVENKTYYYQGNFKVKGIPYNSNYEKETSEETAALSKMIETWMIDEFQASSIHNHYINSQVIKLSPSSDGVTVDIWLMFKSPLGKKANIRRKIGSILYHVLKNNTASLTSDPSSLKLTEISKVHAENTVNKCCGRRAKMSSAYDRIKGGSAAQEGEWPWQASLKVNDRHYCGATLISNRWLVTAAHCFKEHKNISEWTVSFGTVVKPPYMKNRIKDFIVHEKYNPRAHHDDIAVVLLAEPVPFTNNVHRVCLPEVTQNFSPGSDVVVTGWGALSKDGICFNNNLYFHIWDKIQFN
ncbi:transmembrane protease serine 11B-like protein [Antechinus flavipes]|uniref:transmembrane protease serine 11B-like protein n=1 Tax=Antechinus flavipes TaxID=38775 RepID=UPI002236084B|nr:transmembrane protease serine 11B-like protein [Antechinus flavipes]